MNHGNQNDFHLPLLENGLDYIATALSVINGNKEMHLDIKYAIVTLCTGIELVLKERLRREHWTLIFDQLKRASFEKYNKGDFDSVKFDELISRLRDICGVKISSEDKNTLDTLRKKRNMFEHFGIQDSRQALHSTFVKSVKFIWVFIQNELEPWELSKELQTFIEDEIQAELLVFEGYVEMKMNEIQPLIDAEEFITICPHCLQRAAKIEFGLSCLFCDEFTDHETAANFYISDVLGISGYEIVTDGGEWPLYDCPRCGEESYVVGNHDDDIRFICFACGVLPDPSEIGWCELGNHPFYDRQGETVCHECFSARVNSLDD